MASAMMSAMQEIAPLIDEEHAAFMEGRISLTVGSCGADKRPSVARAAGCRVAPDRKRVRITLSGTQAAAVLAHVRETGRIAAVFSSPPTHRTVQLKGKDAVVEPGTPDDAATVARYRDNFVEVLDPLGFEATMIRTLLAFPDSDIVAVSFTPDEAYSQTPGPNAGSPLKVQR